MSVEILARNLEVARPVENTPIFDIAPSRGWAPIHWRELWEYRELLYFFTWRDIKIRYKQTTLGAAWAVIQPLASMVVFTLFFGKLIGVPSDGVPYPIFSYAGLLPWQLFAYALTNASISLITNERLITKVYFPRLLVPLSAVLGGLLDFAIAFVVLLGMMVYFGVLPGWPIVTLPLFIVLAVATAVSVSLWLSALSVQYRDVRHIIPFLTQLWFFATPVVYPSSILPEPWRTLYGLNPMAGVVEGFRWALANGQPPGPMLLVSTLVMGALLVGGAFYFRRMERTFVDVL